SEKIHDLEAGYLDRIVDRHVLQEFKGNTVRDVLEPAVTLAVTGDVGRSFLANGKRRRIPQIAVVFVAKVDCLARRVAHRVVRPWREVILLTVERPGMAAALDRTVEAEGTVADDVDPRRRCSLSCLQNRRVFPSAVGETAQPVEKL